ncbi:MAG: ABC transporter permease subunit [Phycisphaerales bacterium]
MKLATFREVPFFAALAVLVIAYACGLLLFDGFSSPLVIRNLLVDNAFLAIAAAGATLVIISGGIDLSVGALMAFTSVGVASLVAHHGWHPLPAMACALVGGAAFGTAQGMLISRFKLPAFMVTLAGLFLARGAAFAVHPQSIAVHHPFIAETLNESFSATVHIAGSTMTIPCTVPVVVAVLAVGGLLLARTRPGRAIHAIGDDEHAAALMGLPVERTRVAVYASAGFLSAMAGCAFLLYQQSGDPASCKGLELDVIAAVVIGGTLLRGGVGSMAGTAVGVATLALIQTLIAFQGTLSSWWTRIAIGALVLGFVALQQTLAAIGARSRGS